jgi:hypothetical protein
MTDAFFDGHVRIWMQAKIWPAAGDNRSGPLLEQSLE